jgi:hypothetical protein
MKKLSGINWKIKNNKGNHVMGGFTELKEFGKITLDECNEIYNKLLGKLGLYEDEQIEKITFELTEYYEYAENGIPLCYESNEDFDGCALFDKRLECNFFPQSNTMRIWEDGRPIYENANGMICDDELTLADCLL